MIGTGRASVQRRPGFSRLRGGFSRLWEGLGNLRQQPLFANASYLWGVTLVGALTGFVFWGIAAHLYPPEQVGIASAVLSAATLLSGVAGLGMGNSLIRFLPGAPRPGQRLNSTFTFVTLSALSIAGVYLAGLRLWSPSLISLRTNAIYAAGFGTYVVAVTLCAVLQMAFVARRQAGYALAQTVIVSGGRLLLVVLLVAMGAAGPVGAAALATLLAAGLSLGLFLPRVEAGYRPRPDLLWRDLAPTIPYALGNWVAGLLAQSPQLLLPLLIMEMLGPASSGYAYVAWMVSIVLVSPGVALANSAFAEGSHTPASLSTILSRAGAAGLALTGIGAAAIALGAPWLLRLFGAAYAREATDLLRWLAAAAPLAVLASMEFTRLRVQKRIGRLVLLGTAVAIATLGLAAAFMPRYGIGASGVGWLLGNGLVASLPIGRTWVDRARRQRKAPA